ncbi:MAG: hypothetical protein JSU74_00385 [Candidatus Zixiibacteriota bacterium]|nr:MAG: hypothetical protein JSU74_00385 [candidate division Zixibacteria bacterium]
MQKTSLWHAVITLTLLVSVMFWAGCDSSSPSDDADTPTESSTDVTVTATPASITQGSFTVVEALVETDDVAMAGQEITFTVLPVGCGTCSPAVDTTDADGVAATMFTASAAGSVSITATIGGTSIAGTAFVTVTEVGQTGEGSIGLTLTPAELLASGEDTARVTVVVVDANGNPAPDNTLIKLCAGEKFIDADSNGYWSPGVDTLVYDNNHNGEWDAVGNIPSTAYTGSGTGTAAVDFVSGIQAGTYYIKATVEVAGMEGAAEESIVQKPYAETHAIFLTAELVNLVVKHTGGIETCDLYAIGYDVNGNRVPEGMAITFRILDGPDGGEFIGTDPAVTDVVAFTNSQGMATVPISSGTVSGTIRIRAFADTVLSNATQVMVSAGPPKYMVVGAGEECNYPYWDIVNERVEVVAVVSDTFLNPVNDSTVVYFSCDEGSMKSHEGRTENLEGVVTSEWISGNNVATADGKVWIFAETNGGTLRCSTMFINSSPIVTAWFEPAVMSFYADGKSEYLVMLQARDVNNNWVVGGTAVTFEATDIVRVLPAVLENGCLGSQDVVKVESTGNLDYDYSTPGGDDDGIGAFIYVYSDLGVWGGGLNTMLTITLNTGYAYMENCDIKSEPSLKVTQDMMVSAVIADRWGNPLGDHTLILTASDGTVAAATQETDGYGEATGFVYTAPNAAGTVILTIEDTDPRGGLFLTTSVTIE